MNGTFTTTKEAVKSAGLSSMAPPIAHPAMNPQNMNSGSLPAGSPASSADRLAFGDDSVLMDPELIKAARNIYRTFYEVHPEVMQRPIGVAMGRLTHRGKLVFGDKPVLLPQECFVPFSQIEPGLG